MSANTSATVVFISDPIQYQPGQSHNRETTRLIRSHVAKSRCRKKRAQQRPPRTSKSHYDTLLDTVLCSCSGRDLPVIDPALSSPNSKAKKKEQEIADTYKICQKCRLPQFTKLSWQGKIKVIKACLPSIYSFMEAEFDPFESLPEMLSWNSFPAAKRALNEVKTHMITLLSYDELRSRVIPIATKESSLLMGLLYTTCAHLNAMKDIGETPISMAIKTEAIRQIRLRFNDPQRCNTSITVSSIAYLSAGVWGHGYDIKETQTHENAILSLLSQRSRWAAIPEGDVLGQTLRKCLALHQFTRAAVLGNPIGEHWVSSFCQSTRTYSNDQRLPESPLYCPRGEFYSLRREKMCSEHTLRALYNVRILIQLTLEDDRREEYNKARAYLLAMPSCSEASRSADIFGDYIYESTRRAALLLLQAIDANTAFVNVDVSIVEELKVALKKTDMGVFWGNMSGVLFWIGLIGSAAAIGKPQHCFMTAVVCRGDHDLAYRSPVGDAGILAAYKLLQLHLKLKRGNSLPS